MLVKRMGKAMRAACLVCSVLPSAPALAAYACVHNEFDLHSALIAAQTNGENDLIEIEAGVIVVDANYAPVYSSSENKNLVILGGYSPGCTQLAYPGAKTVIDGAGLHPVGYLALNPPSNSALQVSRIVWQNGLASATSPVLEMRSGGALGINHNAFLNLFGNEDHPEAVYLAGAGAINVSNSVFAHNVAGYTQYARPIVLYSSSTSNIANITGNTFTRNYGGFGSTAAIYAQGAQTWNFSNDVVWGNVAATALQLPANAELRYNDIDFFSGNPAVNIGMVSVDPLFVDGDGDYHLQADSPVVNAGLNSVPGGIGPDDYDDNPRNVLGAVDIGAYELQERIFADGFDG